MPKPQIFCDMDGVGVEAMVKRCDLIDSYGEDGDYTKWACEEIDAPKTLLREVQHENDGEDRREETPEERYERMLAWVRSKIKPATEAQA